MCTVAFEARVSLVGLAGLGLDLGAACPAYVTFVEFGGVVGVAGRIVVLERSCQCLVADTKSGWEVVEGDGFNGVEGTVNHDGVVLFDGDCSHVGALVGLWVELSSSMFGDSLLVSLGNGFGRRGACGGDAGCDDEGHRGVDFEKHVARSAQRYKNHIQKWIQINWAKCFMTYIVQSGREIEVGSMGSD